MILQDQFTDIISSQLAYVKSVKAGMPREKLVGIKLLKNFAVIISGIRRSGKSTLMLQLLNIQKRRFVFLNFEDTRFAFFEVADYQRLLKSIEETKVRVLYFDEIQVLPKWELFVRQLLDTGYQVVITGSNATMLSPELGTKLTGRHISHELFPFSYAEYLQFTNGKPGVTSVEQYLQTGGFPEYLKTQENLLLNQLLEDILYRDIIVRYKVRDVQAIRKLAVYLLSNIAKPLSANNLKQLFQIKSTTTLLDYFSYLENTYIVQFIPKFSYSVKQQIRNDRKIYAIDLGMVQQNSLSLSEDIGRKLENVVYMHLRRKYKEIYYYQEKKECDFIVTENTKVQSVIQVCYQLTGENKDREIQGLLDAMEFTKMKSGTIVTLDVSDSITIDDKKINIVKAKDFLMQ